MAKLIPGIKLSPAKNAQVDEYMRDVLENAKVCPGILTYLPQTLAQFRAAAEALHAMVSRPLRWELTPAITEADQKLDKALSALRGLMKITIEGPDAEAAEAAKVVLRMSEIDKITGQEQYDEESGKISAMLTTLLGEYAEQTQTAGIMPYVLQLKERNETLCQLLQERDLQQGEAGSHNTTEPRRKAVEVYQKLVLDVNSVANCIYLGIIRLEEGAANPFAEFIDYMVGHIDRFHREVLHTSSKPGSVEGGGSSEGGGEGAEGSEGTEGEEGGEEQQPTLYTITFVSNGQTVASYELEEGAAITAPAAPTGYHWVNVPSTMPAENVTIQAEEDEEQPPVLS